ncbi:hypothetical protein SAMN05443636_2052 [Halobaculum gomorrense]|uniref:Uncharacterized protein n=1 Tax=Halobaculum gomorrense TaxID=43928 RepID=A0A1M5R5C8_9EURY|nr:hypothetical protein SAMN05443636_2052 [Halobaculum gomorrense]
MNEYRNTTYAEVSSGVRSVADRAVSLGRPAGDD